MSKGRGSQTLPTARARGVVLLTVLLIVALLSALSVRMTTRHSLIVAQARQYAGADITLNYALGAEALARQLLHRDWLDDPDKIDHFGDAWAQPLSPFELDEYEDAFIEVQIRDLGGCFNLNSLAGAESEQNVTRFRELLTILGLPPNLADLWLDWVDQDDVINNFGAEDGEYLLREIAYRAANAPAGDPSELFLLNGVDPQQVAALLPFVCTLPTTELSINLNTAPAEVLASLNPGQPNERLQTFVNSERRYTDVGTATGEYQELVAGAGVLTVSSEFFELRARVQIDDNLTELATLLQRQEAEGSIRIRTLSRDFGRAFVSLYQDEETQNDG